MTLVKYIVIGAPVDLIFEFKKYFDRRSIGRRNKNADE